MICPTRFSSPNTSSIRQRRWWTSLSSIDTKITPSSRSISRRSLRRGNIMQHHLSWRVRSSRSTTRPSQSCMRGEFTLSL